MGADIGTMRTAIAARLTSQLPEPAVAHDTFRETTRAPRVFIVYPRKWRWMNVGCAVEYPFLIEAWVSTDMGFERAQGVLDAYLSPAGTNSLSIETVLEDRTIADDLTTNTTSVSVDPFDSYQVGQLNGTDGWLVATLTVSCYVSMS